MTCGAACSRERRRSSSARIRLVTPTASSTRAHPQTCGARARSRGPFGSTGIEASSTTTDAAPMTIQEFEPGHDKELLAWTQSHYGGVILVSAGQGQFRIHRPN